MNEEKSITQKKEVIITIILSFCFPGMGAVYNGYKWTYGTLGFFGTYLGFTHGIIIGFLCHSICIYQCYNIRKKMNNGEIPDKKGTKVQFFFYFISILIIPFLYDLLMMFLYSL